MKLNMQGLNELRKKVEEQLQNVPEGQRIHIDKELLEELLFETIICNKETGETIKLPIWSGEFLRKIDLSEISFENVAWSLLTEPTRDSGYDEVFDDETWEKFNNTGMYDLPDGQMVDYSYTNAKIDFSKSWEAKRGKFDIICCNFSNVDLSNNDMSKLGVAYNSNLSNTGIILSPDMFDGHYNRFGGTNFSGVDLSRFTINGKDLVSGLDDCLFSERCNLSNTGINITLNSAEMTLSEPKTGDNYIHNNYLKKDFHDMIEKGYLDGCYINGKKMLSLEEKQAIVQEMFSLEERQAIAKEKKAEYEKMKEDLISATISSIEQQISGFGRK